ncbi:YhcN/YlaJ family sporulation lipoprotein [Desmospora profundinema]|uniref:YhcN/YlaJ family sporulation lipoprotein n=1 Tax=Desmospora profundinema TaxID=1571184 RepID=A0ABU1IJB5_9BACL|nr:YhcN/YlaJ family sporulation lipoprotein [Desmospora profundinema]MDR6224848.1 YhcN/YlaJ family sporulation lipoprotein [Desmospora profundinema]
MIHRLFTLICLVGLLFGCQPANKPPVNESAPPQTPHTQRVRQTAPEPQRNANPQAVAERLAEIATQMPQVQGATALSAGGFTIVGIDVDPTLERGRVGTVKYSVAEALKEDPQGSNALVTADVDLVQRLRELADDAQKGRPLAGLAEELSDIAARIVPQPSKQVPRQEEPPTRVEQERQNQTRQPRPPRQTDPR